MSDEATLARLEQRLIHIERVLGRLETQAGELPGLVGTVGDTFDSLVARLADRGVDVDARLHDVLRLVERMTAPETVRATEGLLVHLDAIASLARSGVLDTGALSVLEQAARALTRAAEQQPPAVGPLGALRALGDPGVQRALGFLLEVARGLGQGLAEPRRALGAGGVSR